MTPDDLRKLQWALRRVAYLKANPQHRDHWKQSILEYDLIPDILKRNQHFIAKACAEKLGQPPAPPL
jgi:hypothetical protein